MQLTTIFVDSEGAFVEELAAIAVHSESLQIVDVFHEFAKPQAVDDWCRKHCHGLNTKWLQQHAKYENQTQLAQAFRQWLRGRNVLSILANQPAKERLLFGGDIFVHDLCFPMWSLRELRASHLMTFLFKRAFIPVLNKRCCAEAHSSFTHVPIYRNTTSELAKKRWGLHCALYDCLEAYLFYIEERAVPLAYMKQ